MLSVVVTLALVLYLLWIYEPILAFAAGTVLVSLVVLVLLRWRRRE
jgi:multisubunit Na+/H+ antiporter MnhB subunit